MAGRKQFPSEKQDQYMLRLPDGMRDRLKTEAEKNHRSLNAEIIARLEDSFLEAEISEVAVSEGFKPPTEKEMRRMAQIFMMFEGLMKQKNPSWEKMDAIAAFDEIVGDPEPAARGKRPPKTRKKPD